MPNDRQELAPRAARAHQYACRLPDGIHTADEGLLAALCHLSPAEASDTVQALVRSGTWQMTNDTNDKSSGPLYRFRPAKAPALTSPQTDDNDVTTLEILRRALTWAVTATNEADRLLTPEHHLPLPSLPYEPSQQRSLPDAESARAWLTHHAETSLALAHAAQEQGEHPAALLIVYSLWPWWRQEPRHPQWIDLHQRALQLLPHCPDPEHTREMWLIHALGTGLRHAGRWDLARDCATQVQDLADRANAPRMYAYALLEQATVTAECCEANAVQSQAKWRRALPDLKAAHAAWGQLDRPAEAALTDIVWAGQVQFHLGQLTGAAVRLASARHALAASRHRYDAARATAYLGRVQLHAEVYLQAFRTLSAALKEFQDLEGRAAQVWQARVHEWLGEAARATKQWERAHNHYASAQSIYESASPEDAARVGEHISALRRSQRNTENGIAK
ncbi:hypothetical protein GCM10010245_79740 [Streptomyces spectabilis]|uniref:Tetratricopeptide repeat protein n=1 Tax=Streptomyces spectabilis TaxID=68270 RepID=A0A7W8EZQ3_STRST|nr:hypothetical protein [Streptomyces spectabilis]MBB5109000.1 hypothetical protein [Streptomyces spectabilis]GGV50588.1 hypothetical protein GCM10010245_79740 [Streptomyces spectabilis]